MMDNLGVKRVPFEVILALELVGVCLAHDKAVLVASIDICLVQCSFLQALIYHVWCLSL